jgi:ferredoxin-NADP reductase
MAEHTVKVIESNFITRDVKRFVIHKPSGYTFIPGQATEVAIKKEGWATQFRPFTFTGLTKWEHLELMVKIYPERNSVTKELGRTNAGAELIIREPFGAIHYEGPGVFIAGGSGITPFLSIFREQKRLNQLFGIKLLYSNYGVHDVICGAELHDLLKENYINHYTREGVIGFIERRLNKDLLLDYISDFSQRFYVCGSEGFVRDVSTALVDLGASVDSLVIDK